MIRLKSILVGCAMVVMSAPAMAQVHSPPSPSITVLSTSGVAPFTVHVHALSSSLGGGTEGTARYEWNFGDTGSQYNTMVGWNAAHTYNSPGTYTVALKIINELGQQVNTTRQVNVGVPNRTKIYVSPSGNDANAGTSITNPVRTFDRAAQLIQNNREILFERNGVYNTTATMTINHDNVIIGAYGSGAAPVINFTSGANYARMIQLNGFSQNVFIENIRFDSTQSPNNVIVRGIHPSGTNITVRNCLFNKVSYAMNCEGGVNGFLAQGNWADAIGAYFIWGVGSNHTYLANTVLNSVDEHNIRLGGVSRLNISHNDFTNTAKSTIWCMLGDHAYVAHNTLRSGRFIVGPNFAVGSPSERFPWVVFEANRIVNEGVVLYSGAENISLRNNIITNNSGECFSIWGYLPEMNRTCTNIAIANNTGTNTSSQYGKFIKLGSGAQNVAVSNNLYCAPSLNQPNGAGNVICDDAGLSGHTFRHNLWANSAVSSYVHSTSTGSKTASQWASFTQTESEAYRSFASSDLNAQFMPMFNAAVAAPVAGVHADFNGNYRPGSGSWTAGALEVNSGPPIGNAADINQDGVVNIADMLLVINAWGMCISSSACPSDLNGDGVVNVSDLMVILMHWG